MVRGLKYEYGRDGSCLSTYVLSLPCYSYIEVNLKKKESCPDRHHIYQTSSPTPKCEHGTHFVNKMMTNAMTFTLGQSILNRGHISSTSFFSPSANWMKKNAKPWWIILLHPGRGLGSLITCDLEHQQRVVM